MDDFIQRNKKNIKLMSGDFEFKNKSLEWIKKCTGYEYTYHFQWLGMPIIQLPQDMIAVQEMIWDYKPDLIIETGVARGGSLIFYASLLRLINKKGKVIGVDIDIRPHNRKAIEEHFLMEDIELIEGSSIEQATVDKVYKLSEGHEKIMLILDSNHTHEHVLQELRHYTPLVPKEGYCIVFDTLIEDLPNEMSQNRPWGKNNNPKTAVHTFMKENKRFVHCNEIEEKLMLTAAPDGYLKCVANIE